MKILSLRQRIVIAFSGCAGLTALLFGLSNFLFVYHVEDRFFADLLQTEASYVTQQLAADEPPSPRMTFIRYYPTLSTLPANIANTLRQAPKRREFAADNGAHFHLLPLQQGYLLAEVSEHLIVRNIRPTMLTFLVSLLGAAILFSAILAYLLARRVLKPLQQLTSITDNAAENGLAGNFADGFVADEIGRLAMALEQAWGRINAFVGREQQFTRDVSHELRTPVTISQGALTLLNHSDLSPQQAELVNRLNLAQQQIEQSLDTLLELAREQQPVPGKSLLLNMVEQSILQQQHLLNGKTVTVKLAIAADTKVAISNAPLLILLNNLLGNAFHNTHEGQISICYQQGILRVQDSGPGIDNTVQNRIFEAGVKGPASKGMGIGLSLVRRLCEKWQLDCSISSDESGTCVRLTFPQGSTG